MRTWHLHNWIKQILASVALLAAVGGLTSCDAIYEDQSGCAINYRVAFRFVKNVLQADAFGSQVTTVHLNIYDKAGKLVYSKSEARNVSEINDYFMEVEVMPGTYDLLAWCEGESLAPDAVRFSLGDGAAMSDFDAVLPLSGSAPSLSSSKDIHRLFHGMSMDVDFPEAWGMTTVGPVYLTRDTNHLSVLLQNVDGNPLDASEFTFEISGKNNCLSWRNEVMPASENFVYTPWSIEQTYSSFDRPEGRATMEDSEIPAGVLAEFTTSRLMADIPQRLTVKLRSTGEEVLSIPLIQYLLLVKGKYNKIEGDQNYLDCYDDYTMMFFLGEGMAWVKTRIYINGWRVVPPQDVDM